MSFNEAVTVDASGMFYGFYKGTTMVFALKPMQHQRYYNKIKDFGEKNSDKTAQAISFLEEYNGILTTLSGSKFGEYSDGDFELWCKENNKSLKIVKALWFQYISVLLEAKVIQDDDMNGFFYSTGDMPTTSELAELSKSFNVEIVHRK